MSNTFNFSRFRKYFVYDLKRQWKNIGMLMLIFALSPVIFYMLYMFFAALFDGGLMKLFSGMSIDGPSIWVRFGMAAVMITIFVMLFPSRAYGEITNKAKGGRMADAAGFQTGEIHVNDVDLTDSHPSRLRCCLFSQRRFCLPARQVLR